MKPSVNITFPFSAMTKGCVLFTLAAASYPVQYTSGGVAYISPDVYLISADLLSGFEIYCRTAGITLANTTDPIVLEYLEHLR